MSAHDPRVTLTEAREEVGALCPQCSHRAIWHHDERGCQYHGNGESGCPCALDSDQTVERIIAARLDRVRAVAEQWDTGCAREVLAALDAPQDAPRGPVGGEQRAEACWSCDGTGSLRGGQHDGEACPACTEEGER